MRKGFTLVEMLVVLILLGLAAALVAPALTPARVKQTSELVDLIGAARDAAVRRGALVDLHVERSGAWQIEGGGAGLATGKVATPLAAAPFTLVVSPLGSCAFDVRSEAAARAIRLDPLTCEVRES